MLLPALAPDSEPNPGSPATRVKNSRIKPADEGRDETWRRSHHA
jgi:hypothetical protein